MILKLLWDKGCILYDGFEKVHYEHLNSEDFNKFDTQASWIDSKETLGKSLIVLARRKVPNEAGEVEFSVKTNAVTYLLNDEGKTIERIN